MPHRTSDILLHMILLGCAVVFVAGVVAAIGVYTGKLSFNFKRHCCCSNQADVQTVVVHAAEAVPAEAMVHEPLVLHGHPVHQVHQPNFAPPPPTTRLRPHSPTSGGLSKGPEAWSIPSEAAAGVQGRPSTSTFLAEPEVEDANPIPAGGGHRPTTPVRASHGPRTPPRSGAGRLPPIGHSRQGFAPAEVDCWASLNPKAEHNGADTQPVAASTFLAEPEVELESDAEPSGDGGSLNPVRQEESFEFETVHMAP